MKKKVSYQNLMQEPITEIRKFLKCDNREIERQVRHQCQGAVQSDLKKEYEKIFKQDKS